MGRMQNQQASKPDDDPAKKHEPTQDPYRSKGDLHSDILQN